jgi:hypothetical protein
VAGSGFEHGPHHSDPNHRSSGSISAGLPAGLEHPEAGQPRWRAPPKREGKASSVAGSSVQRQPNMRMKLTARGGRLKRKRAFLSAAATGCSLCAIR